MAYRDKNAVRKMLDQAKAAGRSALDRAGGASGVCEAYGIAVPQEGLATSAPRPRNSPTSIGFPVVMKIVSPQILHKTEAGGVLVGVKPARRRPQAAFSTIVANARRYDAEGRDRRRAGPADAAPADRK